MKHGWVGLVGVIAVIACSSGDAPKGDEASIRIDAGARYAEMREALVRRHVEPRIDDAAVVAAMRRVPRHRFVPEALRDRAYENNALPIEEGQTISQPIIVAMMTELLEIDRGDRVLEVGTGSGYQAAILAELAGEVFTIEIVPELGDAARRVLDALGYENIRYRIGDGFHGWPEEKPFDAIIVTAAPEEVPPPLLEQLRVGGRLVIPVGDLHQELVLMRRTGEGPEDFVSDPVERVRFVPMTGEVRRAEETGEEESDERQ